MLPTLYQILGILVVFNYEYYFQSIEVTIHIPVVVFCHVGIFSLEMIIVLHKGNFIKYYLILKS